MTTKAPAYQRYPKEYMSDGNVLRMTFEERGVYDWLLDSCWLEDGIPDDVGELARLCGITKPRMARAWLRISPCFMPHPRKPGWLTNKRLEGQREAQAEFRGAMSEAGKRGAQKRWGGHKPGHAEEDSQATSRLMASDSSAVCSLQSADNPRTSKATAAAGLRTPRSNGNGASAGHPPTLAGLAAEAAEVLGLGTWGDEASSKFAETKSIIRRQWHGRGVKIETIRAAIHGLRLLVDRGEVAWLADRAGQPLDGIEVLTKNAVVDGGDGGQLGSLFAQAERAWREHEIGEPALGTVRGGGPRRVEFAALGPGAPA